MAGDLLPGAMRSCDDLVKDGFTDEPGEEVGVGTGFVEPIIWVVGMDALEDGVDERFVASEEVGSECIEMPVDGELIGEFEADTTAIEVKKEFGLAMVEPRVAVDVVHGDGLDNGGGDSIGGGEGRVGLKSNLDEIRKAIKGCAVAVVDVGLLEKDTIERLCEV